MPAGQLKNAAPSGARSAEQSATLEYPAHFTALPIVTRRAKATGLVRTAHRAGCPKGSAHPPKPTETGHQRTTACGQEGVLSALALAIYLAARLTCVPQDASQHLKLLVLDDVLVGLDYGNRRPLMAMLEKHFPDWQVVLLTHDRH